VVQSTIAYVYSRLSTLKSSTFISQNIHVLARQGAYEFIAQRDMMPVNWVRGMIHEDIKRKVDGLMLEYPKGIFGKRIDILAEEISQEFSVNIESVERYLALRNAFLESGEPIDDSAQSTYFNELRREIHDALSRLTPRERKVLELRFGLEDGKKRTLGEIAKVYLNVSVERVRGIEAQALKHLRHPRISKRLIDYMDGLEDWENKEIAQTYMSMSSYDYLKMIDGDRQRGEDAMRVRIEQRKVAAKQRWQEWINLHPWPKNLPLGMQETFYRNFADGVSDERIEKIYEGFLRLSELR